MNLKIYKNSVTESEISNNLQFACTFPIKVGERPRLYVINEFTNKNGKNR